MEKAKFEVGKRYYDNFGRLHKCTKRTDKSIWFDGNRFVLHGYYDVEYVNSAYKITADNCDDIEIQRDLALKELLTAVIRVCDNDAYTYVYENEEEIYSICNDLRSHLEEYTRNKVKLEDLED